MIKIYTDGSCLENPGNGGWAAIINNNGNIDNLELSGDGGDYTFNFEFDTNNSPFKNVVCLNFEILLFS